MIFLFIFIISALPLFSTLQAAREEYLRSNPLTSEQAALLRLQQFCQRFMLVGLLVFFTTAWLLAGSHWNLYWMYNTARMFDLIGCGFVSMTLVHGEISSAEFVRFYQDVYHLTFPYTTALSFLMGAGVPLALFFFVGRRHAKKLAACDKHI